ncbi:hypothetical protein TNCV_4819871 [Trichonephila clavipes]|nr:hypothetical protein TNCV_4819871 [Trichonephila clavipes]
MSIPPMHWNSSDTSSLIIETQFEVGLITENNSTPVTEITDGMCLISLQMWPAMHKGRCERDNISVMILIANKLTRRDDTVDKATDENLQKTFLSCQPLALCPAKRELSTPSTTLCCHPLHPRFNQTLN